MVKGFLSAAFVPKPTSVSAQPVTIDRWPPQISAIGTLRAYQGIFIAPQAAGVITAIRFESGQDVKAGDLLINIDDSVEQADLAAGEATLRNAEATLARQKTLVLGATPRRRRSIRRSRRATAQRLLSSGRRRSSPRRRSGPRSTGGSAFATRTSASSCRLERRSPP